MITFSCTMSCGTASNPNYNYSLDLSLLNIVETERSSVLQDYRDEIGD